MVDIVVEILIGSLNLKEEVKLAWHGKLISRIGDFCFLQKKEFQMVDFGIYTAGNRIQLRPAS